MLLGIALILFGLAFPTTLLPLLEYWLGSFGHATAVTELFLASLFPLVGLVVVFIGYFTVHRQPA
jgi:hypothetical protein